MPSPEVRPVAQQTAEHARLHRILDRIIADPEKLPVLKTWLRWADQQMTAHKRRMIVENMLARMSPPERYLLNLFLAGVTLTVTDIQKGMQTL